MSLDIFSVFDTQSDSLGYVLSWWVALHLFIIVISGSSYWMVPNRLEALIMSSCRFDPGKMRDSQAFSDPGFSGYICGVWFIVGFTGFLSLLPYFGSMACEPVLIYTITMGLWWNSLASHFFSTPKNFTYSVLISSKNMLFFFGWFSVEVLTWVTRGVTLGARFLVSMLLGSMGSHFISSAGAGASAVGSAFLGVVSILWGLYEVGVVIVQSYLIGALGILFCGVTPMSAHGGVAVRSSSFSENMKKMKKGKLSITEDAWYKDVLSR